jgi:hypothetical protein
MNRYYFMWQWIFSHPERFGHAKLVLCKNGIYAVRCIAHR